MSFICHLPHPLLRPYVLSIAVSEEREAKEYNVLPSTGLVMGFQYRGNLSYLEKGKENRLSISGITGLQPTSRVFKNTPGTGSVLVHFKEGGAGFFFDLPLQLLPISFEPVPVHSHPPIAESSDR